MSSEILTHTNTRSTLRQASPPPKLALGTNANGMSAEHDSFEGFSWCLQQDLNAAESKPWLRMYPHAPTETNRVPEKAKEPSISKFTHVLQPSWAVPPNIQLNLGNNVPRKRMLLIIPLLRRTVTAISAVLAWKCPLRIHFTQRLGTRNNCAQKLCKGCTILRKQLTRSRASYHSCSTHTDDELTHLHDSGCAEACWLQCALKRSRGGPTNSEAATKDTHGGPWPI